MNSKTKTLVYSSSSSRRLADRAGFGRNRRSRLELKLRLRFRRLLREKKPKWNDLSPDSKLRIEDEWIDWMLIWKNAAAASAVSASAVIVDPTTANSDSGSEAGAVLLNQAFGKRTKLVRNDYLSPADAAKIIQMHFKAHLINKSKAIQAIRELAVANTKLKEIWNLFNNRQYSRHRLSQDAEEHQRFQEKIIVLLLTIDAIDGATAKLRLAKKIMIDELETMLDKTDKLLTPLNISNGMKAYTFDDVREMLAHSGDDDDDVTTSDMEFESGTSHGGDTAEQGAVLLRRAFGRRGAENKEKKWKELSPTKAAIKIQRRFREYFIRNAQASLAHDELGLAEAKLEEIRSLFDGFSSRVRVRSDDAEYDDGERLRFAEKIIVLLLTVDAIQGANVQVRASKRAMVNELETMLEIVDPQPYSNQ